jgi:hypothetical protein
MLIMHALESQNTKYETPKLHHRDKPPKHKKNQNHVHTKLDFNHEQQTIRN